MIEAEEDVTSAGGGLRRSTAPGSSLSHGTLSSSIGEERQVTTPRERAEARRQEKLEEVDKQVESGSLTVRQMTDEERAKYPPPPPRAEGEDGRRGRRRH